MYTIIIGYVLVYIISWYIQYKEWGSIDIDTFVLPIFSGLLSIPFTVAVAIFLPVKYETTTWSEALVSLKDNTSIQGSFFLGSGQINGTMKYVYYTQNSDSAFQLRQVNYDQAKIKYSSDLPHVTITDIRPKEGSWKWSLNGEITQTFLFKIPKGSIQNNYTLDAQ